MALSGTFKNNFRTGYGLEMDWSATQNIDGNTSTITAKLFWCSYGSSYTVSSSATKSASITIDGGTASSTSAGGLASLSGNQRKLIHTFTKTITHNSDGTRSASLSGTFNCAVTLGGTYYSSVTVTGTASLNTIPRASTLTSSISFTAGVNDLALSINRASSSFTHLAMLYVQTPAGAWNYIGEVSGIGTSYNWIFNETHITRMYQAIQVYENRPAKIELRTYNGSTLIGTTEKSGTIYGHPPSRTTTGRWTIGTNPTASLSNYRSNFHYSINIDFGGFTKRWDNVANGQALSLSSTDWDAMYAKIPNSNTGWGTITTYSYYNGILINEELSDRFDVDINTSLVKPSFGTGYTYKDTTTMTSVTGNNQYLIQGKSNLYFELPTSANAVGQKSATIVSYTVTVNGLTKSLTYSSTATISWDFGTVNAGSNITLSVTAVDSRGNSTTTTKTVYVVSYGMPAVNYTAKRKNNFENETTVTLDGSIYLLPVAGVNKNAVNLVQYRYKNSGSSTWGAWTNFGHTVSGASYTATNAVLQLDNLSSWNFEIQVQDKVTTRVVAFTIGTGQPMMFLDFEKKSMGIGKFPTQNDSLEVSGRIIGRVSFTAVTGNRASSGNTWVKVATSNIKSQYAESNATIEFMSSGNGSTATYRAKIGWRVKQQNPLGQSSHITLKMLDSQNMDENDFVAVQTVNNTSEVVTELWAKIKSTYDAYYYTVVTSTEYITWHNNEQVQASYSTGTVIYCDNDQHAERFIAIKNAPKDSNSYGNANFEARTTDGSYPMIGFHRSGYSGTAIYHDGSTTYPLKSFDNNGNGRAFLGLAEDGACLNISNQDCNNIKSTGFYMGDGLANRPSGTSSWIYLEVIRHNDLFVLQRATDFWSNKTWFRRLHNGAWQPWFQLTSGALSNFSWGGTIAHASSVTLTHNLGYNPIVMMYGTLGNVNLNYNYTSGNLNQIHIYNWNTGGNSWTGMVYCW